MKYMPPVWLRYPEAEPDSPAWRMGLGDDYIAERNAWYKQLSADEKRKYDELFPVPILWKGYLLGEKGCAKYHRGAFSIPLWRNKGLPKYTLKKLLNAQQDNSMEYCFFWGHQPA